MKPEKEGKLKLEIKPFVFWLNSLKSGFPNSPAFPSNVIQKKTVTPIRK